jgi:hypothetical protein
MVGVVVSDPIVEEPEEDQRLTFSHDSACTTVTPRSSVSVGPVMRTASSLLDRELVDDKKRMGSVVVVGVIAACGGDAAADMTFPDR